MVKFYKKFLVLLLGIVFQQPLFAQWSRAGMSVDEKRAELLYRVQAARVLGAELDSSFESWVEAVPAEDPEGALDTLEKQVARQEAYNQQQWAQYGYDLAVQKKEKGQQEHKELGIVDTCKKKLRNACIALLALGLPVYLIMGYFATSMGFRALENGENLLGAPLLDICLGTCMLAAGSTNGLNVTAGDLAKAVNAGDNSSACSNMPFAYRMERCGQWVGSGLPRLALLGGAAYVGYKLYTMCKGKQRR